MTDPSTPGMGQPPRKERPSRRPGPPDGDLRGTFERAIADLLRKGIDAGRGSLRVTEAVAPREIASGILSQLGDLRSGIVRAVGQEVGMFLREANIAEEVRTVLDGLGVDAKIELRYRGDDKPAKTDDADQPDKPARKSKRKPRARAPR